MKNINSYNEFINEKLNWSKNPWKFIKNIIKLEEPDGDDEPEELNDNDIVTGQIKLKLSILQNAGNLSDALEKLANVLNLKIDIINYGDNYLITLTGKKIDYNNFYNKLKNA